MFIDKVRIEVEAGKGGDGCVSFRREKYVRRGGPDGGDGGKGGDVVLVGARNMHTLLDFRWRRIFRAGRGKHGMGKNMTGASADNLLLDVPLGTVVKDALTEEHIGEILRDCERVVVARGGGGGRGNTGFKSSTDRAPTRKEQGKEGMKRVLELELKLIADVGIVGLPNAGKSTLLSKVSRATPKIADYPFTTTHANLGVVGVDNHRSFVMADIPGLIEGAHEGKGMGLDFLRHIERTKILLFLLDCASDNIEKQYSTLIKELASYNETLLEKPRTVCINKIDLLHGTVEIVPGTIDNRKTYMISAITGQGVRELILALGSLLEKKGTAHE